MIVQPSPGSGTLQDMELVSQGEVLKGEAPLGSKYGAEQVQDEFEHRGTLLGRGPGCKPVKRGWIIEKGQRGRGHNTCNKSIR